MLDLDLFKVTIYKIKITGWQEHKSRILSLVPFDKEKYHYGTLSYSDYFTEDKHSYESEILNLFKPYMKEFEQIYTISEYSNVWCQGYVNSDWHEPHNHGCYGHSCIFYAHFDSESHPPTEFVSPFPSISGDIEGVRPPVEEGDLIIFPSMLVHTAPPSGSDKERIIFSFNIKTMPL
jgi:hypothetical protein